jgi:GNAT superfamily N-acetyltransferase
MDPLDYNFTHSINVFGSTSTTGRVLEARDLVACNSGAPLAAFNQAALKRPEHKLDRTLERLTDHCRTPAVPFRLHLLRQDTGVVDTLLERGFVRGAEVPCMVFHGPSCAAPAVPGLELRTVHDAAGLEDFGRVGFESFDYPPQLAPHVFTPELLAMPHFKMFVGYLDGAAVCCSAILLTGTVAGIYWVGTLAAQRGRGLGAAVTAHAVQQARAHGSGPVCLQASAMGEPVHRRLGFSTPRTYLHFEHAAP